MFTKVLIANRGAIAVRIIRTLKKMAINSVAVYAEADKDSLHVRAADAAYSLGQGNASDTYLNQQKLLDICLEQGVQAIHPGYGFLSENPDFVALCEQHNIVFLGPTPEHINQFGLKHSARALAEQNNVPLLPGSGLLADIEEAVTIADSIGYPVMLKSTAGGGGIGMQLCNDEQQLRDAYDSVKRLSQNNFGNADLFLEKFIVHARHIEVQVFGDGQGVVVDLGERDCSAQRRNQKVVEETPAPNLPDHVRDQLHQTAVRLCQAVKYRSAGTVEFIYDQAQQRFYFLEVNTRLQVEHGVTEQVFGVDIVEWMIQLGAQSLGDLKTLREQLKPQGHSLQVRLYAEDPGKNFQPCAGLLSQVGWPEKHDQQLRIDHWIEAGIEVSALFDPMLAKLIVTAEDRSAAINQMLVALQQTNLYGIETNLAYLEQILGDTVFQQGEIYTRYLNELAYQSNTIEVIAAGTMTTIQDWPGRTGYWDIGVPPSGPFDSYSFRLGNRLLGNPDSSSGLEITLTGPTLKFTNRCRIVLTGAALSATLTNRAGDKKAIDFWQVITIDAGDSLKLGKTTGAGARSYLLVSGGIAAPDYLGSQSTFTLGQFGGHCGRALRVGNVLHLNVDTADADDRQPELLSQPELLNQPQPPLEPAVRPAITNDWNLHVVYGPHGAPDFFTEQDIDNFFDATWEVHYNSSRTGIRLIGPKPEWARTDGGEAGMHPSNIHDNAYAIGTVDFTGDMPVILGPDGPSLGGFVCPVTVITADLWKLGQLKAGDKIRFTPVTIAEAVERETLQHHTINNLQHQPYAAPEIITNPSPILKTIAPTSTDGPNVVYRPSGDHYLLVEYGAPILDINLRFRVHALMLWLQQHPLPGLQELTPGIRSLQIHYDSQLLSITALLEHLELAEQQLQNIEEQQIDSRIVWLPLSWDDQACHQAVEKYQQSVRKDAPWCPDNIEFIRRINGLGSVADVKKIVFDASYVVMGLGDVYLGAPVATPLDPRHRLVTTKYNPARTWTAENSVGIGGSYLCVYGMEGPGGYQFIGRTLQMWNRYRQTEDFSKPWLLRFFDQIRFYEVSHTELTAIRDAFPKGQYSLKTEQTQFSLKNYQQFLLENQKDIVSFTNKRDEAFSDELARWVASGQINFESESSLTTATDEQEQLADNAIAIDSHIAGNVWQLLVAEGDQVEEGQPLLIIESMKMEIEIPAPQSGQVKQLKISGNDQVNAGQRLAVLEITP